MAARAGLKGLKGGLGSVGFLSAGEPLGKLVDGASIRGPVSSLTIEY